MSGGSFGPPGGVPVPPRGGDHHDRRRPRSGDDVPALPDLGVGGCIHDRCCALDLPQTPTRGLDSGYRGRRSRPPFTVPADGVSVGAGGGPALRAFPRSPRIGAVCGVPGLTTRN